MLKVMGVGVRAAVQAVLFFLRRGMSEAVKTASLHQLRFTAYDL